MSKPAVVYVRMAPALRDALRDQAESSGLSLNTFVVHALAAVSGPEFLRDAANGGKPRTAAEDRRVVRRPSVSDMGAVVAEYRDYWIGKLGMQCLGEITRWTNDHDAVWAWWVGHQVERETLRDSVASRD